MAEFHTLRSHVVPLLADDVDTDQIIPARFLKTTNKEGLADKLFSDWRYLSDGSNNPDFVLNHEASQGAAVILAGSNFGSGSSREHAPWALHAWGVRAVVALSFADIFKNNALKNGILPIVVDEKTHAKLRDAVLSDLKSEVYVELEPQSLTLPDGTTVNFEVDAFAKHCLLNGIDELGYIEGFMPQIEAFEHARG